MRYPAELRAEEASIGELEIRHLPQIVEVHRAAFPKSATTRLGAEVVRRYYEWQFVGPHDAHYLGAWVGERLGGFCICGTFRGAFGGFLAKNRGFLASRVIARPWLWQHSEIRTAMRTALKRLVAPGPKATSSPTASSESRRYGVLAIAVSPEFRRHRLGSRLMARAAEIAVSQGFEAMGLTVSPDNREAIRFYEGQGWERKRGEGPWSGEMVKRVLVQTEAT